jgi:DNA-binding LytR/AlgR family response regulator
MRTLIVDDEPIARRVLRDELSGFGDVEVVGEAANGAEAVAAIRRFRPDLVLLDLEMPGMSGFDVVRQLDGEPLPAIVIVTAYDQHAVKGFEAGAVDYLLKPVRGDRLARCLERIRQARRPAPAVAPAKGQARKVAGRLGEEIHLLPVADVLAFEADGETVWILTAGKRYKASETLRAIEERLAGLPFARVSRGALVNLDHVVKMSPLSSHRWLLTVSNGREVIVSKRLAARVRAVLGG